MSESRGSYPLRCLHGDDWAVGIYHLPEGCNCFGQTWQALCPQHSLSTSHPTYLRYDLTVGERWTKVWESR